MRLNEARKVVLIAYAIVVLTLLVFCEPYEPSQIETGKYYGFCPIWDMAGHWGAIRKDILFIEILTATAVAAIAFAMSGRKKEEEKPEG